MAPTKRSATTAAGEDHRPRKTRKTTKSRGPPTEFSRFPDLPEEIQYQILNHLAPGPFTLRDPTEKRLDSRKESEDIEEHIIRRRTLVAISTLRRDLRNLAIPLLYRHILIEEGDDQQESPLGKLLRTLTQFPERGSFIQQITYTLPGNPPFLPGMELKVGDFFHSTPHKSNKKDFDGVLSWTDFDDVISWIKTKCEASAKRRTKFPIAHLAPILLLPTMVLTPNLTNLNIARYTEWTSESRGQEGRRLGQDKLMKFLMGTDRATETGVSSRDISGHFIVPAKHFRSGQIKDRGLFLFPKHLKRIDVLSEPASSKTNRIVSRMRLVEPRSCARLQAMTNQLEQDVDLAGDEGRQLIPSSALSMINSPRSTFKEALFSQNYLDKIRRLDKSVYTSETNYHGNSEDSMASIGRSLDHAFLKTRRMRLPVVMHSQEVNFDLLTFFNTGYNERFQERTASLTLSYTAMDYEWPEYLYGKRGESLTEYLSNKFPRLRSLDMALFLHKDNRKAAYDGFDPGSMGAIESLTLTTEGLWGPIRKVVDMLQMWGPYSQWEDLRDEEPEYVLDIDGFPIIGVDGLPIAKPGPWEKKQFAVERIPPNCESLCIRDWFCEYVVPKPEPDTPEWNSARERVRASDKRDEFVTAVLNDTIKDSLPRVEKAQGLSILWYPDELEDLIARIYAEHEGRYECRYPTTWWEKFYDQSPPVCRPDELFHFTRRYIPTLFKGLYAMCAYGAPTPEHRREAPMVTQLRPHLKKIVFVYTLSSKLPGRERCAQAHAADLLWRFWYHRSSEEGQGWGFDILRRMIKRGSGIDLEVYEGHVGDVPQKPVWPTWIRRKAKARGVAVSSRWEHWKDLVTEGKKVVEVLKPEEEE